MAYALFSCTPGHMGTMKVNGSSIEIDLIKKGLRTADYVYYIINDEKWLYALYIQWIVKYILYLEH